MRQTLHTYARDRRGVAAIECALGTFAMVVVSLVALDLYRLSSDKTTVLHTAVTLADTMSRDEQVTGNLSTTLNNFAQALSEFLHEEQFPTFDTVFRVAAVHKATGSAQPTVLWTYKVELSPIAGQSPTLTSCSGNREINVATRNGQATLPTGFTMSDEELVIVAEVCVEWTSRTMPDGAVSAYHILPSRDDNLATRLGSGT